MAVRFNLPILAFDDANGNPLAGGYIEFYDTQASTAKDVWEDDDLTIQAANIDPNNPNSTGYQLDSAGRHGDIFLEPGDYKVVVKNSAGTIIKTMDPVHGDSCNGLASSFYDFPVFIQGLPSVGETYPIFNVVRALRLPASLTGSIFTVSVNPTATSTFTLYKNGVSIGTIAFNTSGVPTATFASAITFAAADQFSITAPNPQDSTASDFAFTFKFTAL